MDKQPKRRVPGSLSVDSRKPMAERLCPEHQVLMEPVGCIEPANWYYCPTGQALRAWRSIFKQAEAK